MIKDHLVLETIIWYKMRHGGAPPTQREIVAILKGNGFSISLNGVCLCIKHLIESGAIERRDRKLCVPGESYLPPEDIFDA